MNIIQLSAVKLINGIKTKQFTCVSVMEAYLAQIKKVNPQINALVQSQSDAELLKLAKHADQDILENKPLGKLHGLPMTIKDHFKVKDFIVTRGCTGLKDYRCKEDASIVARLKAEGAIILGITNMPEWGPAFEADNDVYGQTKNPYDLTKTSGGSSGGEAALITSCGSAAGIGSDGGGSIRLPAHFCGITGIKPTQHLVPCSGNVPTDGGIGMAFYTPGPMARYVEDLRLILPIISGWDGIDPYLPAELPPITTKPLKDMRICYIMGGTNLTPDSDTSHIMEKAVQSFKKQDISIEQVDFLDLALIGKQLWENYFFGGDQALTYKQALQKFNVSKPSAILQNFLDAAANSPLFNANDIRRKFFEMDQIRFKALHDMSKYDALICPTCVTPAKVHGTTQAHIEDFYYTMGFNLLGWPACTVRCGESTTGLPIGLQIAAKPWQDYIALDVAEFLEQQLGGWQMPKDL